jgi:hypothetical protein
MRLRPELSTKAVGRSVKIVTGRHPRILGSGGSRCHADFACQEKNGRREKGRSYPKQLR